MRITFTGKRSEGLQLSLRSSIIPQNLATLRRVVESSLISCQVNPVAPTLLDCNIILRKQFTGCVVFVDAGISICVTNVELPGVVEGESTTVTTRGGHSRINALYGKRQKIGGWHMIDISRDRRVPVVSVGVKLVGSGHSPIAVLRSQRQIVVVYDNLGVREVGCVQLVQRGIKTAVRCVAANLISQDLLDSALLVVDAIGAATDCDEEVPDVPRQRFCSYDGVEWQEHGGH